MAWKRLSAVEADRRVSNQHELNGVTALRSLLGTERREFATVFLHLGHEEADTIRSHGKVTWYDARERDPSRSEFRLYYPRNDATGRMRPGDLMVVARSDDTLIWIIAAAGSSSESQVSWLFSLEHTHAGALTVKSIEPRTFDPWISIATALETLDIDVPPPEPERSTELEESISRWASEGLPSTSELSRVARESIVGFADLAAVDPDRALVDAMTHEEWIFREVEREEVERRLARGFDGVDDFLGYSLSVQNRRKSRAGLAFEHHIAAILEAGGVAFERGVRTENDAQPDFVLPGGSAYHDPTFPAHRLGILGAKRTCKDRWRQVLTEAERVAEKHLATVEPSISRSQTDEMAAHGLRLVVPTGVATSYASDQRRWLMTFAEYLQHRLSL